MTCIICDKIATMVAGKKAFCGGHRTEAIEAMKALGQKKTGVGITVWSKEERAANELRRNSPRCNGG